MNEEQRAVLAAIHRMEASPGTLIDEYTVARAADILPGDLTGNEYQHAAGRAQIHQLLDELEGLGLIRMEREGYWRPRTTLSGRRALQRPLVALPPNRPRLVPNPDADSSAAATAASTAPIEQGVSVPPRADTDRDRWPAWWPMTLRIGDPSLTPIVGPIVAVLALILVGVVGVRILGGASATPTPDSGAAQTATVSAQVPPTAALPTSTSANNGGGAPLRPPSPTRGPAPTAVPPNNGQPTPTAGPAATRLRIANTDNKGAFLYVLPAGEKRIAVPEGFILEVIGPDERDTKGNNWKHIRYLSTLR